MVSSIRAALAAYRPGSPDLYRAFRLMIAVDVLVVVALFLYKVTSYQPNAQYYQLLVNYDHGLIRRALMGELLSWFKSQHPAWYVFALGLCAWLVTLAAYLTAFGRTFGFSARSTPLLAFILGSPFFFKNFMYTIGHFDIYGCLVAIIALLLPLNFTYPAIIGAAGVFLVLQHNAHMLLYVPTIAFIAIARFHAARRHHAWIARVRDSRVGFARSRRLRRGDMVWKTIDFAPGVCLCGQGARARSRLLSTSSGYGIRISPSRSPLPSPSCRKISSAFRCFSP